MPGQAQHGAMLTTQLPDRLPASPTSQQAPRRPQAVMLLGDQTRRTELLDTRQVRLCQTDSTGVAGRAKHSTSTSVTSRRPPLYTTTPHDGQPISGGADSTTTTRSLPASNLGHLYHVEPEEPDEQVTRVAVALNMARGCASARRRLRHRRPSGLVAWSHQTLEGLDPLRIRPSPRVVHHPHHW